MFYSTTERILLETFSRQALLSSKKNRACLCYSFILFVIFILLFVFLFMNSAHAEKNPKFLIIHLDALSSPNFFQYMEEGHFPNMETLFKDGDGHIIPYGLSLFPGGTETTVPHMRRGVDNSTGGVGWGYYDREKDKVMPKYITFFDMFRQIPRRARFSFFYGVPWLDTLNFYPLMNIPELLEMYDVIQFFWFATDSLGHYFGEEPYLSSYKRFDRYLGQLVRRLNLNKINLIIYSDHGMSFGRFINNPQEDEIKRIIGEKLKIYIHPNVYLDNPTEKDYWAQKITLESEIDFAFFKEEENQVVGYTDYGKIIFLGNNHNEIRYFYEGEDVFNYYSEGYQGEWLDASEWLSLTRESNYPGVPPNIYHLLMNEKAGDIVIVINPPKIPIFNLRYPANHAGLTKTDLLIPILLRGKDLEHLYTVEDIWLHELFNKIPTLNLDNANPDREKHSFSIWGIIQEGQLPGFELNISPAYRWNIALRYEDERYLDRFEYDLYSSYVIRLWTGVGLEYENRFEGPFLQTRLQMDFGKIRFNYGIQSHLFDLKNWDENRKEIIFKLNKNLSLNWQIPNRIGFSFYW